MESWSGFADSLDSDEDRNLFRKMLKECYKYSVATMVKGEPFPIESLLMAYYYHNKK
jgi:hypothetical protein